jgi:rare lipoprotein A
VLEEKSLYEKTGLASWYGPGFYGKKTASGQILNSKMLSAAHPTLAFGTKLQITYCIFMSGKE